MKLFLSWSGEISQDVAEALKEWFPCVINAAKPFVSSEDIRKGRRWLIEISKELEECEFGIICLTPDNLQSPWLLFEAGALSKSLEEANVCTLLTGGLTPQNIKGPLSNFQHTSLQKEDFKKLVSTVNMTLKTGKLNDKTLNSVFDTWWPKIEDKITSIYSNYKGDNAIERSDRELLSEILELSRFIARNTPRSPRRLRDLSESALFKLLHFPVTDIELSDRAVSALHEMGVETVGQASTLYEENLAERKGVGKATVTEIRDKLEQLGLTFGMRFEPEYQVEIKRTKP
jgi:hypothetical protein